MSGIIAVDNLVGSQLSHARCCWVIEGAPHVKVNVSFFTRVWISAFHVDDELSWSINPHVIPGRVVGTADAAIIKICTFKLISCLRCGGSLKLD